MGCQNISHRGSKINKRKGVIISSRVGAQNVPESCTKVRKLYGRNVSPKHVGVFMSFIRVRELFFHNHHMIHTGQNGQRSNFLAAKHDQNNSARRDNDSKHIIYLWQWREPIESLNNSARIYE